MCDTGVLRLTSAVCGLTGVGESVCRSETHGSDGQLCPRDKHHVAGNLSLKFSKYLHSVT